MKKQLLKIFKAPTLEDVQHEVETLFETFAEEGKEVAVNHSHLMQIGEAESKTMTFTGQPQVRYFFVLVLFYSVTEQATIKQNCTKNPNTCNVSFCGWPHQCNE